MKNNKKYLAAKILLTLVIGIYHTVPAYALPNQGTLDNSAAASIATQGTTMSITGKGANNILNWATFSIDKGETVKFTDKSNYLNLVRGVDISRIYGTMSGGGTVYLVNPNGILFGQGARLDNVGSFIASTRNISAINQDAFLKNPNDTMAVLGTDSKEMDNKDFYPSHSTYVSKLSVADIQLTNVPQSATKIILDGPGGVILKNSALLDKTTQILTRKDDGEIGIGSDEGNIALTDAQKAKISLVDGDTITAFKNNSSVLKGYKTLKSMNDIHAMGEAGNSVKNYILVNDIDASNNGNYIPNSYEGTFDGLGYKIKNLTVNSTSGNKYGGLFTHYDGTVRNVGIENVNINGGYERTGSYVPQSGRATGGLAGTFDGEITNVYVTGSVSGYDYVGGLVGQLFSGEIRNSHNDATVSLKGMYHAGGIVGDSWGSLFNVYNTGEIEAGGWRTMINESGPMGKGDNFTEGVGGIVGSSRESDGQRILFAYNKGNVTGGDYVGGIAGYLGTTAVGEVYNLGKVVARNNTFLSPSNLSIFPENANKVYKSIGGIAGAEGKAQGYVLEHPSYNELFVSKVTNKKMDAYYDKDDVRNYDDAVVEGVAFGAQLRKRNILQKFKPEMFGIYNAQDIVGRSSGTPGQGDGGINPVKPDPVKPDPVKPDPVKPDPSDKDNSVDYRDRKYKEQITAITQEDKDKLLKRKLLEVQQWENSNPRVLKSTTLTEHQKQKLYDESIAYLLDQNKTKGMLDGLTSFADFWRHYTHETEDHVASDLTAFVADCTELIGIIGSNLPEKEKAEKIKKTSVSMLQSGIDVSQSTLDLLKENEKLPEILNNEAFVQGFGLFNSAFGLAANLASLEGMDEKTSQEKADAYLKVLKGFVKLGKESVKTGQAIKATQLAADSKLLQRKLTTATGEIKTGLWSPVDIWASIGMGAMETGVQMYKSIDKYSGDGQFDGHDAGATMVDMSMAGFKGIINSLSFGLDDVVFGKDWDEKAAEHIKRTSDMIGTIAGNAIVYGPIVMDVFGSVFGK